MPTGTVLWSSPRTACSPPSPTASRPAISSPRDDAGGGSRACRLRPRGGAATPTGRPGRGRRLILMVLSLGPFLREASGARRPLPYHLPHLLIPGFDQLKQLARISMLAATLSTVPLAVGWSSLWGASVGSLPLQKLPAARPGPRRAALAGPQRDLRPALRGPAGHRRRRVPGLHPPRATAGPRPGRRPRLNRNGSSSSPTPSPSPPRPTLALQAGIRLVKRPRMARSRGRGVVVGEQRVAQPRGAHLRLSGPVAPRARRGRQIGPSWTPRGSARWWSSRSARRAGSPRTLRDGGRSTATSSARKTASRCGCGRRHRAQTAAPAPPEALRSPQGAHPHTGGGLDSDSAIVGSMRPTQPFLTASACPHRLQRTPRRPRCRPGTAPPTRSWRSRPHRGLRGARPQRASPATAPSAAPRRTASAAALDALEETLSGSCAGIRALS